MHGTRSDPVYAPMLKTNHAMGFRPYKDWTHWQVEVARAKEYLGAA